MDREKRRQELEVDELLESMMPPQSTSIRSLSLSIHLAFIGVLRFSISIRSTGYQAMDTNNHKKRLQKIDEKVAKFYTDPKLIAEYWAWRNRHPINDNTREDIDRWYSQIPHHLRPVWAFF